MILTSNNKLHTLSSDNINDINFEDVKNKLNCE